jgi:PleD family two-component response regulator
MKGAMHMNAWLSDKSDANLLVGADVKLYEANVNGRNRVIAAEIGSRSAT